MSDLIDRQAAIRKLKKMATQAYIDKLNGSAETVINCCIDVIERQIPSAQPETAKRIVGKSRDGMTLWYKCDMCNEPVDAQDDFCRGCGRRLTDG